MSRRNDIFFDDKICNDKVRKEILIVEISICACVLDFCIFAKNNTISMSCSIYNIKKNPFSKSSAEEELDVLDEIYYQPKHYAELIELAKNGHSRFLLGQRGDGKSATIYKLQKDLSHEKTLSVMITRYDNYPLSDNENYFLYSIFREMTLAVAKILFENRGRAKMLNKTQKSQLSLFIEIFYDKYVSEQFVDMAKGVQRRKSFNFITKLINRNVRALNNIVKNAANLSVGVVRTGLDLPSSGELSLDVLSEFEVPEIRSMTMDEVVCWGKEKLVLAIRRLKSIAQSMGYKTVIILFDKIDEYADVCMDVEKVADFTSSILTDTDFLYSPDISIAFSLWSEAKNSLGCRGVRYDKFKSIDIRWSKQDLENLIDKRLSAYSIDKNQPVELKSLIVDENARNELLEVAFGSPRSLINMLGYIYHAESRSGILSFSPAAISEGMIKFCKEFDYVSMLPSKLGKSTDMLKWIDRLLSVKKHTFSADDVRLSLGQKTTTVQQYIDYWKKISLIKDVFMSGPDGKPLYEIVDPKLKFLVSRGVTGLGR